MEGMTPVMQQCLEKKCYAPVQDVQAKDVFRNIIVFDLKQVFEHVKTKVKHKINVLV